MIPDYCDALTAYRCWDAWPNGLLCAQAVYDAWPPMAAHHARCAYIADPANARAHVLNQRWKAAPVQECNCGIYAHKSEVRARERFEEGRDRTWYSTHGDRVWGTVKLWGRVIEHTEGWRAEFAYPSRLFCNNEAIAREVATLYGVPCTHVALPATVQTDADFFDSTAGTFKGLTWASTAPQTYYITPSSYAFWRNTTPSAVWTSYMTGTTAPIALPTNPSMIPLTGAIKIPSASIVKALGGTPYQQRAAVQKVKKEQDWRAVLTRGLRGLRDNPDAEAMTITGATT